jgi:hypothetical protein
MMSQSLSSLALELSIAQREGRKQPRVLVVEARPVVRARICQELQGLGCASVDVGTPLETIHFLEWGRALVQAVAIGPSLTQTRAEELASFLEDAYPDLPVVIVDAVLPAATLDLANCLWSVASSLRDSYAGLSQAHAVSRG